MRERDPTVAFDEWDGYLVGTVPQFEASQRCPVAQVWIDRRRGPGPKVCSGCGMPYDQVHDLTESWVRELPTWDAAMHQCVQRVAWMGIRRLIPVLITAIADIREKHGIYPTAS